MPETVELDEAERRILRALQQDGKLGLAELAARAGLSTSPTWRRLQSLEARGVIRRTAALLDPDRVGFPECVFAHVTLARHDRAATAEFERMIAARPEVLECFSTTGDADYLLRVAVPDTRGYERFLQEAILGLGIVQHVRSNFALREVKFTTALPI